MLLSTDALGSDATRGEVGEGVREGNAEYDQYVPALDGIDGIVIYFESSVSFQLICPNYSNCLQQRCLRNHQTYSSPSPACNASAAIRSKSRLPLFVIDLPPAFLFCSNTPIFSRACNTFRSILPLPSKCRPGRVPRFLRPP